MNAMLQDSQFKKLLKEKQRLEVLSMTIPFVGIISLLIFLYASSRSMTYSSIIILIVVLFLIIGQYVFDSKISHKIDHTYLELNKYFQNKMVPQLLKKDNVTIEFDQEKNADISIVDEMDLFNHYKKYNSRFHYEGIVLDKALTFDELLFDGEVDYNTKGLKVLNSDLDNRVNYHLYTIKLDHAYTDEGIFIINDFEDITTEDVSSYTKIDLGARYLSLPDNIELSFYMKDAKRRSQYMRDRIFRLFSEKQIRMHSIIIYVKGNVLSIMIEEFENLINTPHSKRFTIEKLMLAYKDEQKLINKIIQAFEC